MATQSITLGQKGSGNSTMQLRVTYNPGKNGFTVIKYEGYRTNYDTYSNTDATLSLVLNGTWYGVTCRPWAGKNYWNNFWNGSLWVNQTGGYLEFIISGGNNTNWQQSWFQTDLAGYSVYLRLRTMDCYGNYGSATLWQSWSTVGGYSGSETAYASSTTYNSATWTSTGVWGNVDYTLSCSRKKYSFGITCKDEEGNNVDYSMLFNDTADGTFRSITASPYSTQYVERPYKIKDIVANGYEVVSVKYGGNELKDDSGVYSFTQRADNNSTLNIVVKKVEGNIIDIKINDNWVKGIPYIKKNDNWVKSQKVYQKNNDIWE